MKLYAEKQAVTKWQIIYFYLDGMLPEPSTALAIIPLLVDLVSQKNKK
jgi:hypothetical protein